MNGPEFLLSMLLIYLGVFIAAIIKEGRKDDASLQNRVLRTKAGRKAAPVKEFQSRKR